MNERCAFGDDPRNCPVVKELDRLRSEVRRLEEENKRLRAFDSGEKISPLAAARARNSLAADPAVYAGPALGRDDKGGGQEDRGEQL